jgi:hypothetical protein
LSDVIGWTSSVTRPLESAIRIALCWSMKPMLTLRMRGSALKAR